jgi:hypothetical protein
MRSEFRATGTLKSWSAKPPRACAARIAEHATRRRGPALAQGLTNPILASRRVPAGVHGPAEGGGIDGIDLHHMNVAHSLNIVAAFWRGKLGDRNGTERHGQHPKYLVDGLLSVTTHNSVHRLMFYELSGMDPPEPRPYLEVEVPAPVMHSIVEILASLAKTSRPIIARKPAHLPSTRGYP